MTRHSTRRVHGLMAATIAMSMVSASTVSAQPSDLAFADGEWIGFISYAASHEFASISQTDGTFTGGFDLEVVGGTLEGDFSYSGGGVSENPAATSWFTAESRGFMSGTAQAPEMVIEALDLEVTTTVDGLELPPNSFTLTPADVGPMVLTVEITAATCDYVEGDASQSFRDAVTSAGGTPTVIRQSWTALRVGAVDNRDALETRIGDLRAVAEDLVAEAESGTVDPIAWADLISDSAALLSRVGRSPQCGGAAVGTHHRSIVARWVADLLAAAIEAGDATNIFVLGQILTAAVDAGVIGSGASGVGADDLEIASITELERRLEAAVAADDTVAVGTIAAIAGQMGWQSIYERATEALEAAS